MLKFRGKLLVLVISVFILFSTSLNSSPTSIFEALESEKITLRVFPEYRTIENDIMWNVVLHIERLEDEPIKIYIPAGTYFVSNYQGPDLIAKQSTEVELSDKITEVRLEAFETSIRENYSSISSYVINQERSISWKWIKQLLEVIDSERVPHRIGQIAFWIAFNSENINIIEFEFLEVLFDELEDSFESFIGYREETYELDYASEEETTTEEVTTEETTEETYEEETLAWMEDEWEDIGTSWETEEEWGEDEYEDGEYYEEECCDEDYEEDESYDVLGEFEISEKIYRMYAFFNIDEVLKALLILDKAQFEIDDTYKLRPIAIWGLRSTDEDISRLCFKLLGENTETDRVSLLTRIFLEADDSFEEYIAYSSLKAIDKEWYLSDSLKEIDTELYNTVKQLNLFVENLKDKEYNNRRRAIRSIVSLNAERKAEALSILLDNTDWFTTLVLVYAIVNEESYNKELLTVATNIIYELMYEKLLEKRLSEDEFDEEEIIFEFIQSLSSRYFANIVDEEYIDLLFTAFSKDENLGIAILFSILPEIVEREPRILDAMSLLALFATEINILDIPFTKEEYKSFLKEGKVIEVAQNIRNLAAAAENYFNVEKPKNPQTDITKLNLLYKGYIKFISDEYDIRVETLGNGNYKITVTYLGDIPFEELKKVFPGIEKNNNKLEYSIVVSRWW